jgi:nitrogen fixation/metabolism regulation signal transduction histidine kinase
LKLQNNKEPMMKALQDFVTTDYGLMSLTVIVFTLGMGVFFARYFARHIREDTAAAERAARNQG